MKQQCWHYTITFKGSYTADQKFKMIEAIPMIMNKWVNYRKNNSVIIDYAIEYHKRSKTDRSPNPTAPHVHGVMYCNTLCRTSAEEILKFFSTKYGRTQFFLQEDEVSQKKWIEYCRKDIVHNNTAYAPYEHWKQVVYTTPSTDNFWDVPDIIKDEY